MTMSKAFNKVDHRLLIQKLEKDYGFGGNLLRWFQCYLENRKQRVTVLGVRQTFFLLHLVYRKVQYLARHCSSFTSMISQTM